MTIARLPDLANPALCPRLVVKVGSSLLVSREGVRRAWIEGLVAEIAQMRARGQDVVVVSSGAIALGAATLGLDKGGRGSLADAQAVQGLLAHWREVLVAIGYLDPTAPKKLMPRLNQALNRARVTEEEVHILRGIARAIARHAGVIEGGKE